MTTRQPRPGISRFRSSHRSAFIPAHRVESTVLNRQLDRHVLHLIKIDDHATSEIWLLPKRHVHKTESTVNGWKMRVGSREAIYES